MHILSVQVCILVELYERVRSFVPLVEACASPEAEQAAAPGSHCHGAGGGGGAHLQSSASCWSWSWPCFKDLGFLLCHLAISQLMNSIKFNRDFISCILVKTNTVFTQLFLKCILPFFHLSNLLLWFAVLFSLPWTRTLKVAVLQCT